MPVDRALLYIAGHDPAGRLAAVIHRPEKAPAEPKPGVLFVHDLVGFKVGPARLFVDLADLLAARGHTCLRFDGRGRGDSDGASVDITPESDLGDARAAYNHLAGLEGVQPRRIAVVGLGYGGLLASVLAGTDERTWKTVLLSYVPEDAPALPVEIRDHGGRRAADIDGSLIGAEFFAALGALKPLSVLTAAESPTLLAYGTADPKLSADAVRRAKLALETRGGINVDVLPVEGAGATFSSPDARVAFLSRLVSWIAV